MLWICFKKTILSFGILILDQNENSNGNSNRIEDLLYILSYDVILFLFDCCYDIRRDSTQCDENFDCCSLKSDIENWASEKYFRMHRTNEFVLYARIEWYHAEYHFDIFNLTDDRCWAYWLRTFNDIHYDNENHEVKNTSNTLWTNLKSLTAESKTNIIAKLATTRIIVTSFLPDNRPSSSPYGISMSKKI